MSTMTPCISSSSFTNNVQINDNAEENDSNSINRIAMSVGLADIAQANLRQHNQQTLNGNSNGDESNDTESMWSRAATCMSLPNGLCNTYVN